MCVKLVFQPKKEESHAWTILEVIIPYITKKRLMSILYLQRNRPIGFLKDGRGFHFCLLISLSLNVHHRHLLLHAFSSSSFFSFFFFFYSLPNKPTSLFYFMYSMNEIIKRSISLSLSQSLVFS